MTKSCAKESPAKEPFNVYVHPEPHQTVLPFLRRCLPSAVTQEYLTRNAKSSHVVLGSYSPTSASPPSDQISSTAILDPSGREETSFWFWSSLPLLDTDHEPFPEHDSQAHTAGRHLCAMLEYVAFTYPEMSPMLIGSLQARLAQYLPEPAIVRMSRWNKMVFTPNRLPPPDLSLRDGAYQVGRIEERHLDEILATSTVKRGRQTVLASPSTIILSKEHDKPLAWCFTSREGSVSTLFVQPEARGRGLAKAAMRSELLRAFEEHKRPFSSAEVGPTNEPSLRLCESMGARKAWEVVWVCVDLKWWQKVESL